MEATAAKHHGRATLAPGSAGHLGCTKWRAKTLLLLFSPARKFVVRGVLFVKLRSEFFPEHRSNSGRSHEKSKR
jgi:hypothetical protein